MLRGGAALAVALALLAAVPATELGTRWLVASIDWWAGDRMHIGEVSGRLTNTVRLRDLELRHPSADLRAASVSLAWAPTKLLSGQAHLTTLTMDGVRLELHELAGAADGAPVAALAFELAAPSVTLTDVTIVAGGEEIPIESARLSAHLNEAQWTIAELATAGKTWQLTANAALVPVEPFGLNLVMHWEGRINGAAQSAQVKIAGDSRSLTFDASARTPVGFKASGKIERTAQGYVIEATGAWRDLRWSPVVTQPVLSPEGRLELNGGLDDLNVALDLELAPDGLPPIRLALEGTGAIEASAALPFELSARWRAETASGATLAGELDASGAGGHVVVRPTLTTPFAGSAEAALVLVDEPSIDAVAQWSGFVWPLSGRPVITSREGRLEAKGSAVGTELVLSAALAAPERVRDGLLRAEATFAASAEPEIRASFDWKAETVSDSVKLRGAGTLHGNPYGVVRFTHALSAPLSVSSTGALTMNAPAPGIDMVSEWVNLRWPPVGPHTLASPRGSLALRGGLEDLHAVLEARLDSAAGVNAVHVEARGVAATEDHRVDVHWRVSRVDGPSFEGRGHIVGGMDQVRVAHLLTAPLEVRTEGAIDSPIASPELHLTGAWRDLRWPPKPSAWLRSATGTYALAGPLDALELQLDAALGADATPSARAKATARLSDTGVVLEPIRIHVLGGQMVARGRIGWRPDFNWELEVDARGIDPGARWPQWNGTLDATAVLQGRITDGMPHTVVDVVHLNGHLREYPVAGSGKVELTGERLRAHRVALRSGANRLDLHGEYDRVMDLEFSVEATDLSAVLPEAHGRVSGEGVVSGSIAAPRVNMSLTGQDVRYRDWGAGLIEVDADVSDTQAESRVTIRARNAHVGDRRFGSVELRADGSTAEHIARVAVESNLGDANLRFAGKLEAERWSGELLETALRAPGGETWHLERAAQWSVDAERIRIEQTCLESDAGATACADFERADGVRSSVDVESLPLSMVQPWLTSQSRLTGTLSVRGTWSLRNERLEADLSASVSPGELIVTRGRSEPITVAHADTVLNIAADESGVEVEFRSVLGGNAPVYGHLAVEGLHEEAALDGTIHVSLPQLDPLEAFVAGPVAAEGEAFMEARIGGSVAAPRAEGIGRIEVGRARIPDLGIELSDSWVEARADNEQHVAIAGALRSGQGQLNIDGSVVLEAGRWTANEFAVAGESFEAMRLPEAVVIVSPQVTVSAVGESLEVIGRVVIPRAQITPPEVAERGVGVSGDEVLVDRTDSVSQPEGGRRADIGADLIVVLGDHVVFDGFGLLSRLSGELRVRQAPGGVPEAFGTLDLLDAQFLLYGQRLDIEHGRVTFAGPLNDPGLDIRAVRKAGDFTAGIQMSGTLSNPGSRVYSEPALGEAEAFSLLLTGHRLSNADEREMALLSQAAFSLGLEGSGRFGARIQSALGLDELSVAGVGDAGDASLILGRQLSPDLGVRYVHSLVRQAGSVLVNYRLNDHLSIEAESGVRQGLDLLFSIERDDALR